MLFLLRKQPKIEIDNQGSVGDPTVPTHPLMAVEYGRFGMGQLANEIIVFHMGATAHADGKLHKTRFGGDGCRFGGRRGCGGGGGFGGGGGGGAGGGSGQGGGFGAGGGVGGGAGGVLVEVVLEVGLVMVEVSELEVVV
ncbi:hypothetical protein CK203_073577 [Vitis vinifera]|uniref:Uncharacterized protein n=1 Tax=Vitis vinifera TaxID=29760 RepID=A0A438DU16_VITVI|nr:hypothetical protein CK203_073577 [Vitis vinifera]